MIRNVKKKVRSIADEVQTRVAFARRPEIIRLIRSVEPHTMVGRRRLLNAVKSVLDVNDRKIAGAIVECGVWKGGCAGAMGAAASLAATGRKLWLFDSFEGLPEPTETDGGVAASYASGRSDGRLLTIGECVGPLGDVRTLLFEKLQLPEDRADIRVGWFQDTIPAAACEIGPIAVLRLDGDWYESTRICLEHLYPAVAAGGYVIIDDYGYWEGCRKATDEYLTAQRVAVDLIPIDGCGVYFRKPA